MRLRFAIRDLLWLTLVVAMDLGWWADHRRLTDVGPFDSKLTIEIYRPNELGP
jgi:hypothetical protein